MKFGRKKFNKFLWLNMNQTKENIIKHIIDGFECPREEFEKSINSDTNLE